MMLYIYYILIAMPRSKSVLIVTYVNTRFVASCFLSNLPEWITVKHTFRGSLKLQRSRKIGCVAFPLLPLKELQ